MINVNLSPDKREFKVGGYKVSVHKIPIPLYIFSLVVGVCVHILVDQIYIPMRSGEVDAQLEAVKKQFAELQTESNRLSKQAQDIESLVKNEQELNEKLAVLNKLTSNKQSPLKYLQELANLIPEDTWITDLKVQSRVVQNIQTKVLEISGNGKSMSSVTNFFKRLSGSVFFKNVTLKDIAQSEEVQKFKIEMGFEESIQ